MKTLFHFTLTILCLAAFTQGCCVVRTTRVAVFGADVKSVWASGDVTANYYGKTCVGLFNSCHDRYVDLLNSNRITAAEFDDLQKGVKNGH